MKDNFKECEFEKVLPARMTLSTEKHQMWIVCNHIIKWTKGWKISL